LGGLLPALNIDLGKNMPGLFAFHRGMMGTLPEMPLEDN